LKLAYFINQYPKVSHTFIRREILALERQGFEVQRFALRGWSEAVPDTQDRDEQLKTRYVLRLGVRGLIFPLIRAIIISPRRLFLALRLAVRISGNADHRLLRHIICLVEACRLAPWLREARVQHVHGHFGTNSAEVLMYARLLGGPAYSFTVHGPEEFESPMGLAEKVADASFVAAISSYGRSQLYLRCPPTDWPKINVVRCGMEPSFFEAHAPGYGHPRRLICVGRLCEAKGQLLLIEAMALLRNQGAEMDLVLAGDGPLRSEIETCIERHGLTRNVRITGWISSDAVREEILAARALVLPSFAEGLPVVLMEALALRRPVLTTLITGIPELVVSGENGWLFPAGSIEDLVDAMRDCLSKSDSEIGRMGESGRERVLQRHSVDIEAAKLASLFRASA
jgi:colanic acid/amylovoran biosynthesis glycosyltransferase